MEDPECRICLDATPPFLTNVCACRGSIQCIHESCLLSWIRVKPEGICDVCKQPFAIARPVLQLPYFYSLLFSHRFSNWVMAVLLLLFITPYYSYSMYIQSALFYAYSGSYMGLLGTIWQHSPYYIWLWLHPMLLLPSGQIVYPLPTVGLFFLPTYTPLIYCLSFYQAIWKVHVGILQYIG